MIQTEKNTHDGEKSKVRTLRPAATVTLSLVIMAVAALLIFGIYSSEPKAERETATRETAMLVDVLSVKRGTYAPQITGLGTVTAAQDIELRPRVAGRVMEVSEHFMPGGFALEGETLLKLDAADYRHVVNQREGTLKQTESDLAQEQGRREVAKRDFEVLRKNMEGGNEALALRQPQLEAAEAAMISAQAALDQAKLDLNRTEVTAPFDAQIITRDANVGSEVNPGTTLARLVGTDEYHIIVTVPLAKLKQIAIPKRGQTGATVEIVDRAAWPDGASRTGEIRSLIGAIDNQTRLAKLLVSVRDPLSLRDGSNQPVLIVGSIVHTKISGQPLDNVVKIDRDHLRQDDTVWVMQDGMLNVRAVTVAFRDAEHAYVSEGLNTDDQIVTSNLATVAEGAPLRTESNAQGE
ncbi:efflux RND transporter periplasmic adaptor subunit [Kordiimonas aestuarii]|uniref:efflux RND transporter periplasmic adaptor subunit n=1 Tax=Kordiimonas aestuarii TaxID=1005925 RepID=UPI0021D1D031|nr:efflux RND transporter periplasmic adaptor subunit [Kordiimonas aestuarii]